MDAKLMEHLTKDERWIWESTHEPPNDEQLEEILSNLARERQATASLRAERDALQKFKAYVHKRLDDAGVTVDPDSVHKAEGCRIGGRLDEVFAERAALRERVAELEGALIERLPAGLSVDAALAARKEPT